MKPKREKTIFSKQIRTPIAGISRIPDGVQGVWDILAKIRFWLADIN